MPYRYWISYRLESNPSYGKRYARLIQAIKDASTFQWEGDTTSFHIIESNLRIRVLGVKLVAAIELDDDTIVIRNLDNKNAIYAGNIPHLVGLQKLMPYVEPL
jgi:hypothetical protein